MQEPIYVHDGKGNVGVIVDAPNPEDIFVPSIDFRKFNFVNQAHQANCSFTHREVPPFNIFMSDHCRRLGIVKVALPYLYRYTKDIKEAFYKLNLAVLDTEHKFPDMIHYKVLCPDFVILPEGDPCPVYTIMIFSDNNTNTYSLVRKD